MRSLVTIDHPRADRLLHRPARRVKNVQATDVLLGIQQMKVAARKWEHDTGGRCEGLAATQIGWNARVIILRRNDEMSPVNPNDIPRNTEVYKSFEEYAQARSDYKEWMRCYGNTYDPWFVFINPVILQMEGAVKSTEGCLSVPHGGYEVMRPTHVAFKAMLSNTKSTGVHLAKNESAIKLMHEIDHLEGKTINQHGTLIIGGGGDRL